jgi:dipeptidyl aminopeptidase/acylaminoacyl peptidase
VAGHDDFDIAQVRWIDNERLLYNGVDRSTPANAAPGGLFTVSRVAGKPVTVVKPPRDLRLNAMVDFVAVAPLRAARTGANEVLGVGFIAEGGDARPVRFNTQTGRIRELDFNFPGKPLDFWFDQQDTPRVALATTSEDLQTSVIWYRVDGSGKWRQLASFPTFEPAFEVAGIVGDTLYVLAPHGARQALYRYDIAAGKLGELVLADPDGDVLPQLIVEPGSGRLLGVHIASEPRRTAWFDAGYGALQASLDRVNSGQVNLIVPAEADAARLILSYSSTHPGRYMRFDPAAKKLTQLFARRRWVDPDQMAEQLQFDYTARDGLPIMAYLTVPKGRAAKDLPLIVLPHGGPNMRDEWGYSDQVQFLANRGYVVLQPQYRGSTGFGLAHLKKGFRQWGLAMQDDVTDGVRELVRQNLVDPKRICIMGASYGGYATMMGLIKDPDLYRCGVNLLGVTDLDDLLASQRWSPQGARRINSDRIGDRATMKEQILATSPVRHADRIKAPVLMAYGEQDWRVPISQGTSMRDSLKRAGKTYEWMSFANEEHGFVHQDNRYKVFEAIDAFLRKYNPAN